MRPRIDIETFVNDDIQSWLVVRTLLHWRKESSLVWRFYGFSYYLSLGFPCLDGFFRANCSTGLLKKIRSYVNFCMSQKL